MMDRPNLRAIADSAMGCAVHSTVGRGQAYATLELKVNMVKALTLDTPSARPERDGDGS